MSSVKSATNVLPENFKSLSFAEQVDFYLKLDNDEALSKLPAEAILELRKAMNPYGRTIQGSDHFLNFSVTSLQHEYQKKLLTTAFIGFLHRMCDEWKVPDGVPVVSVYEYLENPSLLDTPELITNSGNASMAYDYAFNREFMKKRIAVKEFLEEMFQFNPDEHVRSAYRPNYKDSERVPLETMVARIAVNNLRSDRDFSKSRAEYNEAKGIITKKVKRTLKNKKGETRVVYVDVPIDDVKVTPVDPTNPNKLDSLHPKDPNLVSTVTNNIPPHDIYGRFGLYYEENYEELRDAVKHLYCEKPDFEFAINAYSWHNTEEEAEKFKKQHANEVISEIYTAKSGAWCLLDPFKKNRENTNFYNDNTIVVEEMMKQLERDKRLGADLMAKRVTKQKQKNIIESGPDAENFAQWRKENSEISKMGAKHIGDMASDETPDSAIEVPIWRVAKGGLEVTRDKIFSMSQAPTFVQEAQDRAKAGLPPASQEAPAAPSVPSRGDNI